MIRVLLVDDHSLVRAGLRSLLEGFGEIEVVGEAGSGPDALSLVETLDPDVILMDIAMPGMNGLEATARISERSLRGRVLILSMYSDKEYVRQALKSGAAGYLLKDSATTELELAVKTVARGENYLSPCLCWVTDA